VDAHFLRLLADEAPVEAFEGPAREARRAGRSPEEVAGLEEAARLALRVRAILAERRRREAELAALNETATDLVSLRDVELVLQAIVRRARHLLGTDTAYLTLIDHDRGDTYMRVTDGMVTDEFRHVRLPFGVGLGGLVAQTRSPYASANYALDGRFAHTQSIDSAVAGERLVAILGVPLLLRDQVLGVLFAADRRERSFPPADMALLSSLAAHAAVAIENARLFQEAGEALGRLNEANRVIQAHSAAVERAAAAHERLANIVLQGGGIQELAGAVALLFDGAVAVVDADGHTLAAAGPVPGDSGDPRLKEALAAARQSGRTVRDEGNGGLPTRWIAPVLAGSEHLGAVVLAGTGEPGDADLRTLERAAQVTALLLLGRRSVAEAEQRVRGELLEEVLSAPDRDPDDLQRRAGVLSANLDRPHVVTVVDAEGVKRHRVESAAGALAAELGGLAAGHAGQVVLVVPGEDAEDLGGLIRRRLGAALGARVTVGAAGPASGAAQIARAHGDAARCRRLLAALGRAGDSATVASLGIYALLLNQAEQADLDDFVTRTLGPLLEYDRRRGASLVATLDAYFGHAGHLGRTAEALHVHVNTLYQRMGRVAALVGEGWQQPDRALTLHLALKIHRLRTHP
jgi:DNA-binding PucR family transcriptional regulator